MTSSPPVTPDPPRVLVLRWAAAIGAIAVAGLLPIPVLRANLAGVAAFCFIALPDARLRRRGEDWDDYGAPFHGFRSPRTWREVGKGAAAGLLSCAVVFPLFGVGFAAFTALVPHLPLGLAGVLSPYLGAARPALRLPDGLALTVVLQVLVVALPEELFYRGWMQTSWARSAPGQGVRVLGARLGRGFLLTQLLFAAGHLVTLQPWRLATFFPALWFGWLRERTGGLAAPIAAHAASNVFIKVLEASFYG